MKSARRRSENCLRVSGRQPSFVFHVCLHLSLRGAQRRGGPSKCEPFAAGATGRALTNLFSMSQPWAKKQINALELYTIDVIYGRRAGAGPALYGAFLQALSWLFNG